MGRENNTRKILIIVTIASVFLVGALAVFSRSWTILGILILGLPEGLLWAADAAKAEGWVKASIILLLTAGLAGACWVMSVT